MNWQPGRQWLAIGAVALLSASALAPSAHAEDFLSALFGAFGAYRPTPRSMPLPFASEGEVGAPPAEFTPADRRRGSGLLRAHLRWTLFSDIGLRR